MKHFEIPIWNLKGEYFEVTNCDLKQNMKGERRKKQKEIGMNITPITGLERRIFTIRGQRVMIDADLAELYGVITGRLNEQVKRNRERFPEDFMFQLTKTEYENLKSQFATSSWGGRRKLPYAFLEHGAIMAANVLNSKQAIQASVYVVRAFIRMREGLIEHKELARKVNDHERLLNDQDEVIISIVEEMGKQRKALPPVKPKRKIGLGK